MILIKNGYDVYGERIDVLVKDGKIADIRQGDGSSVCSTPAVCGRHPLPRKGAGNCLPLPPSRTKGVPHSGGGCSQLPHTIDATGLVVAPGLVDMHVHFRDPGFEYKEDILTGAGAAAAGGVTTCCCMPNTNPVADNKDTIKYIADKASYAPIRVLPVGAVTFKQKGSRLTSFNALAKAGAVAFSNDGLPISSAAVMRNAMLKAKQKDYLIISHAEDDDLAKNHAVNDGHVSKQLGLPGRPAIAEDIMVARDVALAAETGARLHIAHVSTANSVDIIRRAKEAGVRVTAETCPQYFTLTEDEILSQGTAARVNPPLRTWRDVEAIKLGLEDGTIDAIATDHAPHSSLEKELPLIDAPSGMIGLETSLALALTFLYHRKRLGLEQIIKLMSTNPAKILGIEAGVLETGKPADIVLFDPNEEWTVDSALFKSKSSNTPFNGMKLRGKVTHTICRGKLVYG